MFKKPVNFETHNKMDLKNTICKLSYFQS